MHTGLRYTDECGWYALLNGKCVQPEIDGTLRSAERALKVAQMKPASGGFDRVAIDWRNVGQLEAWERLDNEPGYYESTAPYLF